MEKVKRSEEINPKLIPEVNIGMVGHVAHGKTTLTQALTGKSTLTHSEELKRGITIRLGYADATFYKCPNNHYGTSEKCAVCFEDCEILRTVSFIDVPGHETLMATVLTGASLMNGALLIIAANEKCPQPQTREHLTALEVVGIKDVIIVQTKIDLVSEKRAIESHNEIKNFVKGSILEDAPVIPVSSQQRINIDAVIEGIQSEIHAPKMEENGTVKMFVARSFDINKPGIKPQQLKGGILGGAIVSGRLKIGEEIEIHPGVRIGTKYAKLSSKVVGLQKAGFNLEEAGPGGLLGVMTELDPSITKSDTLVGNVVGLKGKTPEAVDNLSLEINLLDRVVGAEEMKTVSSIRQNEDLLLNAGTSRTIGNVSNIKKDKAEVKLKIPIVVGSNERIVISRMIAGRWRLIGFGIAF